MKNKEKFLGIDLGLLIEQETKKAMDGILDKEKIRQQQQADAQKPFKARKKSSASIDKDKLDDEIDEAGDEESKDGLKAPAKAKASKLPEITLTKIIALLNSLRAGKSLKDEKAKVDLKAYFTRLNGSERVALYAFLTGLDKIMGSEEGGEGDKAPVPKQDPYKIKMKKDTVKADKKPPAGEGSPIVVGESANKSKEKSILWRNK